VEVLTVNSQLSHCTVLSVKKCLFLRVFTIIFPSTPYFFEYLPKFFFIQLFFSMLIPHLFIPFLQQNFLLIFLIFGQLNTWV